MTVIPSSLTLRYCAVLSLACVLAACGSDNGNGKGAVSGSDKVLPGTISDRMIAYDTLRSTPPAEKIVPNENAPSGGTASATPADGNDAGPQTQASGAAADQPAKAVSENAAAPSADREE